MTLAYDITLFMYNLALMPMVFFSVLFIILCLVNIFYGGDKKQRYPKLKKLPFISVQIPSFNDPIAVRCVKHCLAFDYPKNKYEIVIADDSTNKETQNLLKALAKKHKNITYCHRTNRSGYKPGALNEAMSKTKGDIIVVFDSDWMPKKDFLKNIIKPFADPKVSIVQARQAFYNHKTNIITRFAAYTLMIYHTIVLPICNKANCVFFCGTAGAIRRTHFEEVGGWNQHSIVEDADLSVRLLLKGYKTVYYTDEVPSEVPDTIESFIRQQMRWCYGMARVFCDNMANILYKGKLTLKQRFLISYITMGNIVAPIVVIMAVFGLAGWYVGEPTLFTMADLGEMLVKIALTSGFFVLGLVAFFKLNRMNEYKHLVLGALSVGLLISITNSIAFFKALFNRPLSWYCTPKVHNTKVVKE